MYNVTVFAGVLALQRGPLIFAAFSESTQDHTLVAAVPDGRDQQQQSRRNNVLGRSVVPMVCASTHAHTQIVA